MYVQSENGWNNDSTWSVSAVASGTCKLGFGACP